MRENILMNFALNWRIVIKKHKEIIIALKLVTHKIFCYKTNGKREIFKIYIIFNFGLILNLIIY